MKNEIFHHHKLIIRLQRLHQFFYFVAYTNATTKAIQINMIFIENLRWWIDNIEQLNRCGGHPPNDHLLPIGGSHPHRRPRPQRRIVPRNVTSGITSRPSAGRYRTWRGCLSLRIPADPEGLPQIFRLTVMPIALAVLADPGRIQIARVPRQPPGHHSGLFSVVLRKEGCPFRGHPVGAFIVGGVKLEFVYV